MFRNAYFYGLILIPPLKKEWSLRLSCCWEQKIGIRFKQEVLSSFWFFYIYLLQSLQSEMVVTKPNHYAEPELEF